MNGSPGTCFLPPCPERRRRDPAPRRRVRRFFSTRRLTLRPYADLRTPVPRVRFSRFLRPVLNLSQGTVIFRNLRCYPSFQTCGRRPEAKDLKEMLAHSNPEMTGAVADEARKVALRVPSTDASLATRLPAGAGHCISNRHPCRLETTLNPCASTTAPFLIVTKSRANFFAFSSYFSASPRLWGRNIPMCGLDALARGLRQPFPRRSRHSCLPISSRNIPLLDTSVNACKHTTSLFLRELSIKNK